MKTALCGLAAFALGLSATAAAPHPLQRDATKKVSLSDLARPQFPPGSICVGGMEGPMAVEIVPERTDTGPRGESLAYSVRLRNRTEDPIRARYAVELVTDTGAVVTAPEIAGISEFDGGAERSDGRSTPAGLPDDFYILRVTAAAAAPSGDSAEVVHLFFEVRGGHVYPIDTEEFYARSSANEGVIR